MGAISQFPHKLRHDHSGPETPAMVEFDEDAFPELKRSAVDASIWARVYAAIDLFNVCPFCRGQGKFSAALVADGQTLSMTATCGQCCGSGTRDEADAREAIDRALSDMRSQFLED